MQLEHLDGRFKPNRLRQNLALALFGTSLTFAATAAPVDDTVRKTVVTGAKAVSVGNPSEFNGDLRDIKPAKRWQPGEAVKVANPRHIRDVQDLKPAVNKVAKGIDPLLKKQFAHKQRAGAGLTAVTEINIDGMGFSGVNPPDTTGDIGLKYYIQSINSQEGSAFTVHDKTTGELVAGPLSMSSLATGDCTNTMGDPIVLFDEQAKRWLLTEFTNQETNKMCVLVSKTEDPLEGGWHAYEFQAPSFPDYPKYSQIGGVYYVSANEGLAAVYALERSKMLNGEPAAMIRQEIPGLAGFGFHSITPIDVDGALDAPEGTPGLFIRQRDDELHNAGSNNAEQDFLELWSLTPDFANPENSKVEGPFDLPVAEFSSDFVCQGFACLEQKGSSQTLDPLREVVMYKGQYRRFDGHESIVGNFITNAGDNIAALRWFELRRVNGGDWSVHQEGTFNQDDQLSRYMGASAMDGDGNIAIAYMTTGKTRYPSLALTGRLAGDAEGVLTFGETMLAEGDGPIESDRDGDYSQMGVDPVDNCTMWFTGEYGGTDGQWRTRITSLKVPSCGDPNPGFTLTGTELRQEVCTSGDLQPINISASGYNDFAANIKLTYAELPSGITGSFSNDTFKAGEQTAANLTVAEGTAEDNYAITIKGNSDGARERTVNARLRLVNQKPTAALSSPENNADKVSKFPTLSWNVTGHANTFVVEIATDAEFSNVVATATIGGGTNYRPSEALAETTTYYWRVKGENSCGAQQSEVFKFTTGSDKEGATQLNAGVASQPFAGAQDSENWFYIDVPDGTEKLGFQVSGDNGDADLYISHGARPTSAADLVCRAEQEGSNEACNIESVQAGTYYALVYGYFDYENATIKAVFDDVDAGTGGGGTGGGSAIEVVGQTPLSVDEDGQIEITLEHLQVNDETYPTDYAMLILPGDNYTAEENVVKPAANFDQTLQVNAVVGKGDQGSEVFAIEVTVNAINDAPAISAVNELAVDEDTPLTITADNLTIADPDSDSFTVTVMEGENYTVSEGTITPAANYNGALTVKLKVSDGELESEEATAQVTVNAVNDEPVATNDTATVEQDSTNNVIDVLANDSDVDSGDSLTLSAVNYSGSGSASISGGKISYTPKSGFNGSETLQYTVKDSAGAEKTASVTITVTAKPKKSGGSTSWLMMLLLAPLAARRFKR